MGVDFIIHELPEFKYIKGTKGFFASFEVSS